jgi:protein O-GlcNAc transferase
MNVEQVFQTAVRHHHSGRLSQAKPLYQAILAEQPDHADALHMLGVLLNQSGHPQEACELIGKAISIKPTAEYYHDLAGILVRLAQNERAIEALRQVIAMKPTLAAVHSNMGLLLQSTGQTEQAIQSFQQAVSLEPNNAEWYFNLGGALHGAKKHAKAVDAYSTCLRQNPKHVGALNNLGYTLHALGRFEEAEKSIRRALEINPALPEALATLGDTLTSLSRFDEAIAVYQRAISAGSRTPAVHNNLGNALWKLGRYEQSTDAYRQALALDPTWPGAHENLSNALRETGDHEGAVAAGKEALRQRPDSSAARRALAQAFEAKGEMDQSVELYERLIASRPDDATLLNGYAAVLCLVGRLDEALSCFRRAANACPSSSIPASSYLFTLQFHTDDPVFLLDEHRKWDARYAAPLKHEIRPFVKNRSANRRLRIGYVSPDFRRHVMSLFYSALFPHHDHGQFEIFCYSGAQRPDAITALLQKHADVWRPTANLSDAAMADLIRADDIDILVDLSMHMSQCRPLVFARKPAPIQVAWLAYPGTTGLATMDYRLTDPYLDPPGFETRYTERTVYLPETFWCYDPKMTASIDREPLPEPGDLPAAKNGIITFGCFNNFSKINTATLQRWGRLMQGIEQSRLHMMVPRGRSRERVLADLQPFGITADRIEFIDRQPRRSYLCEFQRVDMCLDTLPYNGHTTSLDSFWMGVPVLTQIGRTLVGRAGLSQLMNLQLPDFAAETEEQFIALGRRWANDLPGLAEIRRTLRERMASSPLMDSKKFAGRMESAFRHMWQQWIST